MLTTTKEIVCMEQGELNTLKNEISHIQKDVSKLNDKFDTFSSAVISIDKTMVKLEETTRQLSEITHVILPRIRSIEQQYVTKEELTALAMQVQKNKDFVIKASSWLAALWAFLLAFGDKIKF
jgi:DNA anti-recombination protein RmuC